MTSSVAYPQSLSLAAISFPLGFFELARIREPWRKTTRRLWSCLSPIAMDVVCSNTTSVETNQRFQIVCPTKRFAGLKCPPVSASSKDAAVGVHSREVAEEPEKGAPVGDLNGTP